MLIRLSRKTVNPSYFTDRVKWKRVCLARQIGRGAENFQRKGKKIWRQEPTFLADPIDLFRMLSLEVTDDDKDSQRDEFLEEENEKGEKLLREDATGGSGHAHRMKSPKKHKKDKTSKSHGRTKCSTKRRQESGGRKTFSSSSAPTTSNRVCLQVKDLLIPRRQEKNEDPSKVVKIVEDGR
ncbi:unnamed protein product [Allacma fusca]|uniref:Uncharacterized protein n=1 Tax=Allacma fusca TaxID=39272 RepID=A0A8J2JAX4_9HEXA|nr:unnamed protein product [Allacma fusca]